MKQQVIGIDIDGVLANFNIGYRQKLIDVTGRDLIPEYVCRGSQPGEEPPCWDYAPHFGYTKDEDRATWKAITGSDEFWVDLPALPGVKNFLWALDARVQIAEEPLPPAVYFITTRPGVDVKGQSEQWLSEHGVDFPTVLIARNADAKGQLAAGLGLTHFIDDRPENCLAVKTQSPSTQVFLLSCRYNEWAVADTRYDDIERLFSLQDFERILRYDHLTMLNEAA